MQLGKLKSIITADMAGGHSKREYANTVFNSLLDNAKEDETYVTIALPIANYAVDHLTLTADSFVKQLEIYVKNHTTVVDGNTVINIEEDVANKYPIDETMGSKLTALACEFVENNK